MLAEVVFQNRQAIGLLTAEQGGTCTILNETCFVKNNLWSTYHTRDSYGCFSFRI